MEKTATVMLVQSSHTGQPKELSWMAALGGNLGAMAAGERRGTGRGSSGVTSAWDSL